MKRKIAANWPLLAVVGAIVASGFSAFFIYGLSFDSAALLVLLKATVLGGGLLIAWVMVKRAGQPKSVDEQDAETGDVDEVGE